jgi:hypothetical protein
MTVRALTIATVPFACAEERQSASVPASLVSRASASILATTASVLLDRPSVRRLVSAAVIGRSQSSVDRLMVVDG